MLLQLKEKKEGKIQQPRCWRDPKKGKDTASAGGQVHYITEAGAKCNCRCVDDACRGVCRKLVVLELPLARLMRAAISITGSNANPEASSR